MPDLAQSRQALAKANEVKSARYRMLREIRAGERTAQSVIVDPPAELRTMEVIRALTAVRYCGMGKATRILQDAQINPSRFLEDLTQRQRGVLLVAMRQSKVFRVS